MSDYGMVICRPRRVGMQSELFDILAKELENRRTVDLCFLKKENIDRYMEELQERCGFPIEHRELHVTKTERIYDNIFALEPQVIDLRTYQVFTGIRIIKT